LHSIIILETSPVFAGRTTKSGRPETWEASEEWQHLSDSEEETLSPAISWRLSSMVEM
jgi:hypothetical protein